jgi:N-dimethylarginine dimethylaminohydrolase
MSDAPRYGVQSMVDPLRRVLIRRPVTHGDFAAADWREPDPARLTAEHEAFGELLAHLGCEVVVAAPLEGLVDSVYVCDPVWVCGQGAIVLQSAKPQRVGEGEGMVPDLEAAGVPIVGRLTGAATADGGDMVWLDHETLAVARGYRTNAEAHRQLDEILAAEGAKTLRFDLPHDRGAEHVLHLMSFISPVTLDLAVVFEPLARHRRDLPRRGRVLDDGLQHPRHGPRRRRRARRQSEDPPRDGGQGHRGARVPGR